MPSNVQIVTPSAPLRKAFSKNVQKERYNDIYTLARTPPAVPNDDGFFAVGNDGTFSPQRILLSPYCEGQAGSVFWMMLYGWRSLASQAVNESTVWIYYILAEFLCVAGIVTGPLQRTTLAPGPVGFRMPLGPTERLCESMMQTDGILGANGFINYQYPGSGRPACAAVELQGVQLISFDFYQAPNSNAMSTLAANCLFTYL